VIPIRDENPVSRPAVLTWLIIGACLAVYFLWQPSPLDNTTEDVTFDLEHAAIPCEIVKGRPLDLAEVDATFRQGNVEACDIDQGQSPVVERRKSVWLALVISMFLHGGLLHIAGNLLFLWVFGNNVEDVFGKVAFAAFYLIGGIVAAFTHIMLNLDSTVPVIGASGAIAAVMGAYLVLFPSARIRTVVFVVLIFVVNVRAFWVLSFWFVLQFFTDPNQGVAWGAHVGGFVFGVLVGLVVRAVRGPQDRIGRWSTVPRY
jgi:rhomboid family protein